MPKLTYANVVSTLALFVAITGTTAYAASQLAPKSVGEPQLRPGAVTADKIRKNAVTAPKIKAQAIKQGKLANGSVTAAKMTPDAIATGSLANGAVTNEKLAPEAVTGDKVLESTLSQVPSAARADFATNGESANPPAFAKVNKEATLDSSLSKNIAALSEGSLAGIYCLTAAGFNPRGAQVTPFSEGPAPSSPPTSGSAAPPSAPPRRSRSTPSKPEREPKRPSTSRFTGKRRLAESLTPAMAEPVPSSPVR
jgi:hypothetical protein